MANVITFNEFYIHAQILLIYTAGVQKFAHSISLGTLISLSLCLMIVVRIECRDTDMFPKCLDGI